VKHAGPETLADLEPLFSELRPLPYLVEKRPGVFYRKGKAMLHFHEDENGAYADLRLATEWERLHVATPEQRGVLLERIQGGLASEAG
jgi:hypothetical protein